MYTYVHARVYICISRACICMYICIYRLDTHTVHMHAHERAVKGAAREITITGVNDIDRNGARL